MMNKYENLAKAKDFMERAKKALRPNESIDLIKNAANHFRLAQDWKKAAKTFLRAAELEKKSDIGWNVSSTYNQAAKLQIKYDKTAAVQTLELEVGSLCSKGRIYSAASVKEKIGEIYEVEKEYLLAAKSYQEAFDLYEMDALTISSVELDMLLKAAELKVIAEASQHNISEAIEIYRNVIFKYGEAYDEDLDEIYFRLIMLLLANDDVDEIAEVMSEVLSERCKLKKSKGHKCVEVLVKAFKRKDFKKFSDECRKYWKFNYKKPSKLWRTNMLNRIKENIE